MDQIVLVEEQIKAGQKLIELLNEEGIPVLAGGWIKESEGGQYLYLVTPLVGEDGATKPAYRRIVPVIRRMQEIGLWIDPFEVKVVGPTEPLAQAIMEVQRRYPGRQGICYGITSLAELPIDGAYIYPAAPAPAA